ncbi:hypothetical protein D3C87_898910 [compost metagenome]
MVPVKVKPVAITVLPVAANASAKVAVPPVKVTSASSPVTTPVNVLVKMLAVLLPS